MNSTLLHCLFEFRYFIFQKYEGYHAIKIKPMEIPSFTFKAGKFCF